MSRICRCAAIISMRREACADTFLFKTGGRPHGVLQAEPAAALCEHTYLFSGLSEMWRDETPLTARKSASWMRTAQSFISNWCRRSQRSAICTCCSPQRAMATSVNSQTLERAVFLLGPDAASHGGCLRRQSDRADQGHDRGVHGAFCHG